MVVGTAGILWLAPRHEPPPDPPKHEHSYDPRWLSKDATARLIGEGGVPGPLFAGIHVGAPEPSAEVRARIATFARDNHVAIDFDVEDGLVDAIRLDVTFGGGFGYEGADVLALRVQRPSTGHCCVCGEDRWIDDWAYLAEDGTYVRGRVRVNRVTVRWERALAPIDLVERADALLGADVQQLAKTAGDRWIDLAGGDYGLEVPCPVDHYPADLRNLDCRIDLHADRGHVVSATVRLFELDDDAQHALHAALRARWGRARHHDDAWTWRTADRTIVAELGDMPAKIELRSR